MNNFLAYTCSYIHLYGWIIMVILAYKSKTHVLIHIHLHRAGQTYAKVARTMEVFIERND